MSRATQASLTCLKFSVEAVLVFALVVGVAYGAMRLAEHCAASPISPEKGDVVTLPAAKASRSVEGQPPLFPTEKEQETDNYGNEYGRELAKERESRKLGPWTDLKAEVSWQFRINTPGMYEVELNLAASEQEAGSEYEVKIGKKTLSGTVASTGGEELWETVSVGRVELSAGLHTLEISPRTIKNRSLMNLSCVVLRLVVP